VRPWHQAPGRGRRARERTPQNRGGCGGQGRLPSPTVGSRGARAASAAVVRSRGTCPCGERHPRLPSSGLHHDQADSSSTNEPAPSIRTCALVSSAVPRADESPTRRGGGIAKPAGARSALRPSPRGCRGPLRYKTLTSALTPGPTVRTRGAAGGWLRSAVGGFADAAFSRRPSAGASAATPYTVDARPSPR
jgi:hypothetical protein